MPQINMIPQPGILYQHDSAVAIMNVYHGSNRCEFSSPWPCWTWDRTIDFRSRSKCL